METPPVTNDNRFIKLSGIKHIPYSEDNRKILLGLLEKPNLPLSVDELKYRIFVAGRAGSGKSFLISWLAGLKPLLTYLPTPGIQTTVTYCPAHIQYPIQKEALFTLHLWESGASGKGPNADIFIDCPDNVDAVLLIFSYNDKKKFSNIPKLMEDFKQPEKASRPIFIAVGTGCGLQEPAAVTEEDITEFENKWKVPVVSVPQMTCITELQAALSQRREILTLICERLWLRDKELVLKGVT